MSALTDLADYFRKFPGIGPRQAKRFVYFLLTQNQADLEVLSAHILGLKKSVKICQNCFRYFPAGGTATLCKVCADPERDLSTLIIVSRDVDLDAIEKSGLFTGRYFVLGGVIPVLEKDPGNRIRLRELMARLQKEKATLKEIILAMNLNAEGENTEDYLRAALKPLAEETGLKISLLGRGLSTGSELEYSDKETLKNALKNRQ